MGAITTRCCSRSRQPGTTIALAEGSYYGTSVLFRTLEHWGLSFVEYDQTGTPPDADIVWVESPANPLLTVPNWEALRAHRGLVVCDATASTPVYLRALDQGADIVVHSATKYLTGRHDALLGATVTRDPEKTTRLRDVRARAPGSPRRRTPPARFCAGSTRSTSGCTARRQSATTLADAPVRRTLRSGSSAIPASRA